MSYLELLATVYVGLMFLFSAFRVLVDWIVIKERSIIRDLQHDRGVLQQNYSMAIRDNDILRQRCSDLLAEVNAKKTEG